MIYKRNKTSDGQSFGVLQTRENYILLSVELGKRSTQMVSGEMFVENLLEDLNKVGHVVPAGES